jgi:hypothetical protein
MRLQILPAPLQFRFSADRASQLQKIAKRARYLGSLLSTDQLYYFCSVTNNRHRKSSTNFQGRCKDFAYYVRRCCSVRRGRAEKREGVGRSPGTPLSVISNSNWNSKTPSQSTRVVSWKNSRGNSWFLVSCGTGLQSTIQMILASTQTSNQRR